MSIRIHKHWILSGAVLLLYVTQGNRIVDMPEQGPLQNAIAMDRNITSLHVGQQVTGASRGSKTEQKRAPSICIIDDSADMVGDDGFSVSRQHSWPILTYALPWLGCNSCCYWSSFRAHGMDCVRSPGGQPCAPGNPQVPQTLTMTSPLTETLNQLLKYDVDRDIYFITNGLDWRVEGGDRNYRVEMNVGEILGKWMSQNRSRSIVVGLIQDNSGSKRRSNLILGFVDKPPSLEQSSCESPIENLPSQFVLKAKEFHNPSTVLLEDNILQIWPSLVLTIGEGASRRTRNFEITSDGIVTIPLAVFQNNLTDKLEIGLTFSVLKTHPQPPCWGILASLSGKTPISSLSAILVKPGRYECRYSVPSYREWNRQSLELGFIVEPAVPSWATQSVPEKHALRQTVVSFQHVAVVQPHLRVAKSDARPISGINIRVVAER